MRFTVCLTFSALCTFAAASLFDNQHVLDDKLTPIPGQSPLTYCEDHNTVPAQVDIEYVNLEPNPPVPGARLYIEAAGNFTEDVEEGAYVLLTVKYGLITLINTKELLCDQLKNVGEECPVKKGELVITKEVDIPKQVPPGKYNVKADAYTVDHKKLTCLLASVTFTRG